MRQIKAFTISIIAIIIIVASAVFLNNQLLNIPDGGVISKTVTVKGVILSDWEQEDGFYTFNFTTDQIVEGFHIMFKRYMNDTLEVNGRLYKQVGINSGSIYYIDNTEGSASFKIKVTADSSPVGYLGSEEVIIRWLNLKAVCDGICIALNIFLLIYALFLYYYKRSEGYLLYFTLYLSIMLIWSALTLSSSEAVRTISRMIFVLLAVTCIQLCLKLTDVELHSRIKPWFSWKFYIPVCVLYLIFIEYPLIRILVLLILAVQSIYVLSFTGSLLLLSGMIFIAGTRPIIILLSSTVLAMFESLPFYIARSTRLLDTPFLIGCFFYVTRKFAFHFSESERLAKNLDELVRQRTADLVKQQEQRQGMMINIFHDLRTPLFTINQYLEMLESDKASLQEFLPVLKQRSSFVTELTEQLFLVAKLERNQILLNCKRVNLSDILKNQCNSIAKQANSQAITLRLDIGKALYVWGDALRLEQIVQNLLINALHYTPQGGVIDMSLSADSEQVVLRIKDNGKGISPEEQEHIFDRYYHIQNNSQHDSTGLGLTIAKELTVLHRGTLTCKSEPGEGTKFIVAFPLLDDPEFI